MVIVLFILRFVCGVCFIVTRFCCLFSKRVFTSPSPCYSVHGTHYPQEKCDFSVVSSVERKRKRLSGFFTLLYSAGGVVELLQGFPSICVTSEKLPVATVSHAPLSHHQATWIVTKKCLLAKT